MKYEFHWLTDIDDRGKSSTEETIREGQESGDSPIAFCHDGPVIVTLSLSDASRKRFVGSMACSCGKRRGTIKGKCDGSSITFEAVIA
jgi:hypothetical protein